MFSVRRADIESARDLEAGGRARSTVTRRLCTIAGSCKYAVEEELLDHSPAAHVRRLRVDYESHAVALDCNELGALLVAAGLGSPPEHALISLLALNGLLLAVYHDLSDEHREYMKSQGVDPADYVDADDLGLLLGDEFRSTCTRSSRASTAAR